MEQNPFGAARITPDEHKKIIAEARAAEGIKGTILGMHDYRSNLRELSFILKRKGAAELLEYVKNNPLKSFSEYYKKAQANNADLSARIERDLALYPGIVREFEKLIVDLNTADSEEKILEVFNALEHYFKSEN
jgi:hypothetical protein